MHFRVVPKRTLDEPVNDMSAGSISIMVASLSANSLLKDIVVCVKKDTAYLP